jgi:HK97 family phage major capsid protein
MKRAFPGHGPDVDARYERAGHWLMATVFENRAAKDWCDRKGVRIVKAQGEGIGTTGGFTVPTELENAILDLRDSFGMFRRRACVWPMGSDSSVFPRRTGGTSAYFFGENVTATTTGANMDGVTLNAKKLGALVTLSSEVEQDSLVDLVDYIANELAWAFAAKEDDCVVNGDGTAAYGGIRGFSALALDGNHATAKIQAAAGHNTYGTLDSNDLGSLMSGVRASAYQRAAWFVSSVGFALAFGRIAAATGGMLSPGEDDGIPTQYYNGFPVILTQKLPQITTSLSGKAMMAFGDMFAAGVLGQRRGLTIARSDHRYLDTDQIAILGTERFDAVIHDMGDNTNTGSLAVLVAP